jgi:hypothetical protein
MRSHVFLTPMTPDGKPGVVQEIMYNEAPPQFAAPVPHFATYDGESVTELQKARDALVSSLPKLKGGARSKADHRIRLLEREIRTALEMEEAARRHSERVRERQRQQGGDSPFAQQTLSQRIEKIAASVAHLPTRNSSWSVWCEDFDKRLAAHNAKQDQKTCCRGQYLCATCKAKRARAAVG